MRPCKRSTEHLISTVKYEAVIYSYVEYLLFTAAQSASPHVFDLQIYKEHKTLINIYSCRIRQCTAYHA